MYCNGKRRAIDYKYDVIKKSMTVLKQFSL